MKTSVTSQKSRFTLHRSLKLGALLTAVAVVSACGVMSNPDRKETPSRLMLEAQAAYDSGDYAKAQQILEKLLDKDPSNIEGRIRLAFAYNGTLGITPVEFIKTLASSGGTSSSGSSDIGKLTGKSSLPDATVQRLKTESANITTVQQLRTLFPEFATFQKAFLTLCPIFSKATMVALKTKAASALDLLEVSKCGDGRDSADAMVSIAALSMALGQFSSLYKSILDSDGNGKFDLEEKATSAKTSIDSLNTQGGDITTNLNTLKSATSTLTYVGSQLQGEVFKLAISQFSIIDAVISGTNLPADIKTGITAGVSQLNTALNTINGYLDAGKSTGGATQTGTATTQAAQKAKDKADALISQLPQNDPKIDEYCKEAYCFNQVYKTGQTPTQCEGKTYTCSTTPTLPPQ